MFTAVGCATISVFIPAAGGFSHFAYPRMFLAGLPPESGVYYMPKFEYYRHAARTDHLDVDLQGIVTFPSFHCCLAPHDRAQPTSKQRRLFSFSLLWNGLVIVSTIPIGGHYVVDLPAGAAIWALAYMLATALWRGTGTDNF